MNKNVNDQDFTLFALNDIYAKIEKTNKKLNRVKFMNKVYFGFVLVCVYSVYKTLTDEIKEKENNE